MGPQIMPGGFNISSAQALESLSNLENLDADAVLFGHGDPWHEGVPAAVESARRLGPS